MLYCVMLAVVLMTWLSSVSERSSTLARFSGLEGDGATALEVMVIVVAEGLAGALAGMMVGRLVAGLFAHSVVESESSPVRSIT
jgi:hypothetical protein